MLLKELISDMPVKQWKNEREFTPDVLAYLRSKWCWVYKLTDASMGYKPFDAIVTTYDWKTTAVEFKVELRKNTSIDILRPNQVAALRSISTLWGDTSIVIFMKRENRFVCYTYSELVELSE